MEINKILSLTKKLNVLFVEDDNDSREEISKILKKFFNKVIIAVDGEDGLEKFKQEKIDLVITDINMPKLNGLDMIIKIKEIKSDINTIILSAYNETEYFINAILIGVNGFLLKPFVLDQFISTLQRIYKNLELQNQKQELEYLLSQYQDIVDTSMIVCKFDKDKNITYKNKKFLEVFTDLSNKFDELFYDEDLDKIFKTINNKKMWSGVVKNKVNNHKLFYSKIIVKPILNEQKEIIEFIVLFVKIGDVLEQKKMLLDYVDYAKNVLIGVIYIFDFENLRDYFGEKLAIKINFELEKVLKKHLPKGIDNFYNLNNGYFAVAFNLEKTDKDKIINDLKKYQEIINTLHITINELVYDVSIIMAISDSDNALEDGYVGIKQLKNSEQIFIDANGLAEKTRNKAKENLDILHIIKLSIDNSNIISYYQPIIDNKTKETIKYESLVRIEYNNKIYLPYQFLDVAKQSTYYYKITEIMIKNAFDVIKKFQKNISVNLSAIDIEKDEIRNKIYLLLEEYKEYTKYLTFEILEDENIKKENILKEFFDKVKSYKVQIAVDDFGSGYSNFIRISKFKPDVLKIDGSLIKNIVTDKYVYTLVKLIVDFAKSNNIQTIAEFVENEEIYNILKELGVEYSQGYYFAKPQKMFV